MTMLGFERSGKACFMTKTIHQIFCKLTVSPTKQSDRRGQSLRYKQRGIARPKMHQYNPGKNRRNMENVYLTPFSSLSASYVLPVFLTQQQYEQRIAFTKYNSKSFIFSLTDLLPQPHHAILSSQSLLSPEMLPPCASLSQTAIDKILEYP